MKAKLSYLADSVRNSYWFVPSLMTVGAVALSVALVRVDRALGLEPLRQLGWWVYTGGAEGAREVLSTVASSMITVAGVVFSVTIVALALASSQFGPRVLASFMRDRGNQLVLGTFIATFLYCVLVLRTIRNGDPENSAVVPHLSTTVAIILAIASVGVLIYFIHHVAVSIQAPHLIAAIAGELEAGIDHLFPTKAGEGEAPDQAFAGAPPERFEEEAQRVLALRNGYVEAIDTAGVLRIASERDLLIVLDYRPGQFVVRGSTLARVWPPTCSRDDTLRKIEEAFVVGTRRTSIQDLEFPVHQLVEIAVRALSPGINDPFTANSCIDRLGAALCHLAHRRMPSPYRVDDRGKLRLVVHDPITFEGLVGTAFEQIRQNAGHHTAVYLRILEALTRVAGCTRSTRQKEAVLEQAQRVLERSAHAVPAAADRTAIEAAYRNLHAVAARS